jgi:hypothetical protein
LVLELEVQSQQSFPIFVNKKEIRVTESSLTGGQILRLGGFDPNQYDLFLVQGQQSTQIGPGQSVDMQNGLHFNAILKNVPYGDRFDPGRTYS